MKILCIIFMLVSLPAAIDAIVKQEYQLLIWVINACIWCSIVLMGLYSD